MRNLEELNQWRNELRKEELSPYPKNLIGFFGPIELLTSTAFVYAENGISNPNWEHLTVIVKCKRFPTERRCPTWEEMCQIKDMFFSPDEEAVQIHPKEEEYVNILTTHLHLWRLKSGEFPLPPKEIVYPPILRGGAEDAKERISKWLSS